MTVTEKLHGRKLIAIATGTRTRKVIVNVGSATVALSAGQTQAVTVSLNGAGSHLLDERRHLNVTLTVTQSLGANQTTTVSRQTVTFRAPRKPHSRH
jgi:hypothetical protein